MRVAMPNRINPEVGAWYQDQIDDRLFEVVAVDEEADSIDIQYFEGEIQEFDLDTWENLELENAEPPEDWTGAYEVDGEDDGVVDKILHPDDNQDPLDSYNKYDLDDLINFEGDDEF